MRAIGVGLFTATLVLACGDNGGHHLADGGADAPPETDGGPQIEPVTVTGAPPSAAKVYFLNADSSVVKNTIADANGEASAIMEPGGSVTVAPAAPWDFGIAELYTVTGVKPGDHLHFNPSTAGTFATFDLTIPTDPNPATTKYELFSTCFGADADVTPPTTPALTNAAVEVDTISCGGTADWLIQATGSGSGVDYIFAPDVSVVDGVDVTLPDTAFSYSASAARTFTATNLEPEVSNISTGISLFTAKGQFGNLLNQVIGVPTNGATTSSATLVIPQPEPALFAAYEMGIEYDGSFGDTGLVYFNWGDVPDADVSVDISSVRLKHLTTDSPTFDPGTQTVHWAFDPNSTGLDGDLVKVDLGGSRVDPSTEMTVQWTWEIVGADPSSGALTLPTLPTDIFDFALKDSDDPTFQTFVIGKYPGGYDQVHQLVFEKSLVPIGIVPTGSIQLQQVR